MLACALLCIDPKEQIDLPCSFQRLFLSVSRQHEKTLPITCGKPRDRRVQITPLNVGRMIHKSQYVWTGVLRVYRSELLSRLADVTGKLSVKGHIFPGGTYGRGFDSLCLRFDNRRLTEKRVPAERGINFGLEKVATNSSGFCNKIPSKQLVCQPNR
jgi:hypothetical protein